MALSITPRLILAAAEKRGWKTRIIDERLAMYRLELPDGRHYYLRGITSAKSAAVNMFISDQKDVLSAIAKDIGITVPESELYLGDFDAAAAFLQTYGRVVVKPTNCSHGNGITVDITTEEHLKSALDYARQFSKTTLLQQHIIGDDYRLLLMDGELAAAAVREPASVIGDGVHTVRELIELENSSAARGDGYGEILTRINSDVASRYLDDAALSAIPESGQKTRVVGTANIGQGGVSLDVTDTVSPQLVAMAQKIVSHLGIVVCGVDFLVDAATGKPYLIELNCAPSLGLHEYPYSGTKRNTPDRFLDVLTT